MKEIWSYLPWQDEAHWSAVVAFGKQDLPYQFRADWNNRNHSWLISLAQDEEVILQGIQLVLGAAILINSSTRHPSCTLLPLTDNPTIERISFDHMVNQDVKLYHFTTIGLDS